MRTILAMLTSVVLLLGVVKADSQPLEDDDTVEPFPPEVAAAIRARQSPLPLQAAVCDIVGVGTVTGMSTNRWGDIAHIAVSDYWIGNPGSNTLSVSANRSALTVTNTPIIFFATSYELPHYYSRSEPRFSLFLRMPEFRQGKEPREPWFYDNERSWFFATPENADLVAFASNLVTAAQISTNRMTYYELIRDGFRLNPTDSRIHIDSEAAFINSSYWMPTNFMHEIWSDPELPASPRADINNNHMLKTGHWIP